MNRVTAKMKERGERRIAKRRTEVDQAREDLIRDYEDLQRKIHYQEEHIDQILADNRGLRKIVHDQAVLLSQSDMHAPDEKGRIDLPSVIERMRPEDDWR